MSFFHKNPCKWYQFDFQSKGFQVKLQTTDEQFFLYRNLQSVKKSYLEDDRLYVLTFLFKDSIQYTFPIKTKEEADRLYAECLEALNREC